jgi:hypothetical protein
MNSIPSAPAPSLSLTLWLAEMNNRKPLLDAAFLQVQPKAHWKDPIDAIIAAKDREIVAEAIEFFTATKASFEIRWDGRLHVTAPGYRAGPAGDH